MFEIIAEEQTPKVMEISSPNEWVKENKELIHDFLTHAKSRTSAVGLAANQLMNDGERFQKRMFCSRADGEGTGSWEVYINPKITKRHGEQQSKTEGCLTWPGNKILAERNLRIDVEWISQKGETKTKELVGWEAQVWQHEQDHLDGVEANVVAADHLTVKSTKIGRNQPCPCGKAVDGKPVKYKKCCGK